MSKVSVSDLKNNLSAYLRRVRAGQTLVIHDRDVPIARIDAIERGGAGRDRLMSLRAQGITRPPKRRLTRESLGAAFTALPENANLVGALQQERDSGR
jgi:prevent-host-death family protein